jgi:hypothetical protein
MHQTLFPIFDACGGTCPAHNVITRLVLVNSKCNAIASDIGWRGALIIEIAGTSPAMTVFCVFES